MCFIELGSNTHPNPKPQSLTLFSTLNQRFYGASFKELNDPMEGLFYARNGVKQQVVHDVERKKGEHRIVSFSSDPTNVLLWAHYADSFRGVCIGVEIDDQLVEKINYENTPDMIDDTYEYRTAEAARSALTRKLNAWSYESEYRVLLFEDYLKIQLNITEIRLGQRIDASLNKAVRILIGNTCPILETKVIQMGNSGAVIPTTTTVPVYLPGTPGFTNSVD